MCMVMSKRTRILSRRNAPTSTEQYLLLRRQPQRDFNKNEFYVSSYTKVIVCCKKILKRLEVDRGATVTILSLGSAVCKLMRVVNMLQSRSAGMLRVDCNMSIVPIIDDFQPLVGGLKAYSETRLRVNCDHEVITSIKPSLWKLNILSVSADGKYLFIGANSYIYYYKTNSNGLPFQNLYRIRYGNDSINYIRCQVIAGISCLVSVHDSGAVRIWEVENMHKSPVVLFTDESVWSFAAHTDSSFVFAGSNAHRVTRWDLSDERPNDKFKTFAMHEHNLPCIDVSPCGEYLLTVSIDQSVRIWHLRSGREVAKKPLAHWGWCCLWLKKEDVMVYEEPSLLVWTLCLPEEVMGLSEEEEERRLRREEVVSRYEREMGRDLSHYRAVRDALKDFEEERRLLEEEANNMMEYGSEQQDLDKMGEQHVSEDSHSREDGEAQADEVVLNEFLMQALSGRRGEIHNENRRVDDRADFPIYDMSFVLGDLNEDELHALLSFRQLSHQFEQLVDMQQQLPVVNMTFADISQVHASSSFVRNDFVRKHQEWPESVSLESTSVYDAPSSQFLVLCSTIHTLLLLDHDLRTLASISRPFGQCTSLRVSDGMKKISILLFIAELSIIIAGDQGNCSALLITIRYNLHLERYELIPEKCIGKSNLPIVGIAHHKIEGCQTPSYKLYILFYSGLLQVHTITLNQSYCAP